MVIVLLLVAACVGGFIVLRDDSKAAANTSANVKTDSSLFSFTGADGWRKGPSNKTSMALFYNPSDCFTSIEYKTGTINEASELKKTQDNLTSSGYTVTPGITQTLSLQTSSGMHTYELHQSTVATPESMEKLYAAQEFGYLQLPSGYLKIIGYCDSVEDLPVTIPALQAIKFTGDK